MAERRNPTTAARAHAGEVEEETRDAGDLRTEGDPHSRGNVRVDRLLGDDRGSAAADSDALAEAGALFPHDEAAVLRARWRMVQEGFVDRPRESVADADRLVADVMQRLAGQFAERRKRLEQQWDGQEDISTEDLRVAMTSYRSFFERLLSV